MLQRKYSVDAVIFSWNDNYKLAQNENAIAKWLQSNMFESKKSFFLSSASVYKDSAAAHYELSTNLENNEKLSLEKILSKIFIKKNTIHTNLRISNVYGLGLDYGFIGSLFKSIQSGSTVGIYPNLNTTRDYIHIDDVISAIETLIKIDTGKDCINISTGIGTTISQVLDIFANKGYKFENRKEITLTSKSKLISILDCSTLANLISWSPSTLATTIDKLIPNS
ncbi:NAD-dependent epimerase/dehydratase family protein [bacterium]|nr:NAD-dependent epimerase/dehydratase family protein [bacterium]